MNEYQIIISNQSGAIQNYKLFNEPPEVTGGVNPQIWSNVYQTADYTQPGALATFSMWKTYYGIVGTIKGNQAAGAMVQISQSIPVTLGQLKDDGTTVPGTTLTMAVAGGVQPYYTSDSNEDGSYANCFAVATEPTYTVLDAQSNNFMIGVATSTGKNTAGPVASFMPEPGCTYEIQPKNSYYVSFGGSFNLGELADVAKIGNKCTVDFTKLPTRVYIVHTSTGKLVVQLGSSTDELGSESE